MRKLLRKAAGVIAAGAVLASGATAAFGDIVRVVSEVTIGEDRIVEATHNANETVYFWVESGGQGGLPGCDATAASPARLSYAAGVLPAGVTVAESSIEITGCGEANKRAFTFKSTSTGDKTIPAVTVTDSDGNYNVHNSPFTLRVAASNTAPTVSVAGVTDGASYNKGAVPTVSCVVSDAEDTNESATPQLSAVTGPHAADGIGSQTASCSYTDGGGLTRSASATYSIVDPSAPTVGYTLDPDPADGNNDWYKSDVTLTWNVADAESSMTKTGCVDQTITQDQAPTSYSCSATSAGGASGPVSITIKRDGTPPDVSGAATTTANGAGWHNSNVTIRWTCSDAMSGLVANTCPADGTISTEGDNESIQSGIVLDIAGNTTNATSPSVKLDKTVPTVTGAATTAPNANGWYNGNVSVQWTCFDALSLVASCPSPSVITAEGSSLSTSSGTVYDNADNTASATVSGINIDRTKPTVAVTGVADGAKYIIGTAPSAGCSTGDALSGVDTAATAQVTGGPLGSIRVTCSGAVDRAGNTNSASVTYSVEYDWTGFFQPIDNNGVFNRVKAGSAVPVKFSLGGDQGMGVIASGFPRSATVTCGATAIVDDVEQTVTAGSSSLSYDSVADQYVYVWKTDKAWGGTCRQLQVKLADGTVRTANFTLTK